MDAPLKIFAALFLSLITPILAVGAEPIPVAQMMQGVIASHPTAASGWVTTTKTCAAYGGNSAATSFSCTWSSNPAAGESVFCAIETPLTGSGTFSLKDSALGALTPQPTGSPHLINSNFYQVFYEFTLAGSISTITATATNVQYTHMACDTATDSGGSPALDGTYCTGFVTSGTSASCSSALTLVGNDYIFAYAFFNNSGTISPGTGYTLGASNNVNVNYAEYRLQTSSATPSISTTASAGLIEIIGTAFKP